VTGKAAARFGERQQAIGDDLGLSPQVVAKRIKTIREMVTGESHYVWGSRLRLKVIERPGRAHVEVDGDLVAARRRIAVLVAARDAARLELGGHQYGLLAGVVASIEYLANLDDAATGTRREKLSTSMQSAGAYLSHLFDYMMVSLRSLPLVMGERVLPSSCEMST